MGQKETLESLRARIAQIEAGPVSAAADNGESHYVAEPPVAAAPAVFSGLGSLDEPDGEGGGTKSKKDDKPKDAQAAYQRILRIAGTREQSTERVREKLLRAEFPSAVVDEAIDRAVRVGVLDNRRYCDALVRSTVAAQKGLSKVLREIESLGVDPLELDSYQEYLEHGEEAQLESACAFLAAHPARSKNPRESAFRKLVSRGFSVSVASQAARRAYPWR